MSENQQATQTEAIKTPASQLNEFFSRRGINPTYELLESEPTFSYRVAYKDKVGIGAGCSKREGKQAAAKALIAQLSFENTAEEVQGNPIGMLQEMCVAKRWPPPIYAPENEVGLPYEEQFGISCQIFENREIGRGRNKKIAKKLAAHKMLQTLTAKKN